MFHAVFHHRTGFGVGGCRYRTRAGDGVVARAAVGGQHRVGLCRGAGVQRVADGLGGADVVGAVNLAHLHHISAIGRAVGGRRLVAAAPRAESCAVFLHPVLQHRPCLDVAGRCQSAAAGATVAVGAGGAVARVGLQTHIRRCRRGGVQGVAQCLCGAHVAGRIGLAQFHRVAAVGTAIGVGCCVAAAPAAKRAGTHAHPVFQGGTGFGVGRRGDGAAGRDAIGSKALTPIGGVAAECRVGGCWRAGVDGN